MIKIVGSLTAPNNYAAAVCILSNDRYPGSAESSVYARHNSVWSFLSNSGE